MGGGTWEGQTRSELRMLDSAARIGYLRRWSALQEETVNLHMKKQWSKSEQHTQKEPLSLLDRCGGCSMVPTLGVVVLSNPVTLVTCGINSRFEKSGLFEMHLDINVSNLRLVRCA